MLTICIKNTFINVFDTDEFRVARRHHSYPPSPRNRGTLEKKNLTFLEELEKPPLSHSHGGAPVQASQAKSSGDETPTCSEKPASSKKKRRRANRPCKGKRDRYLRFMMRVCSEVYEDPTSFNLNNVELPPSLTSNPKKYQFFQGQIQSYQRQLLDGENTSGSQAMCFAYLNNLAQDEATSELSQW